MPAPLFTSFVAAAMVRTLPVPRRASELIFATLRREGTGERSQTSLPSRSYSTWHLEAHLPRRESEAGYTRPLALGDSVCRSEQSSQWR